MLISRGYPQNKTSSLAARRGVSYHARAPRREESLKTTEIWMPPLLPDQSLGDSFHEGIARVVAPITAVDQEGRKSECVMSYCVM